VDWLLGEWGIRWDQSAAARQFRLATEARRQAEVQQQFKLEERDWCVGSKQFRADVTFAAWIVRWKNKVASELRKLMFMTLCTVLRAGGAPRPL
jgi:hypothetical protein